MQVYYAEEVMGLEKYASWQKITWDDVTAFPGFSTLMGEANLIPGLCMMSKHAHLITLSSVCIYE